MKASMLEDEFAPLAVRPGDELLLLEPEIALRLVGRASDEGVPILGIDGFDHRGISTEPVDEHSADFSSAVADGHGCWDQADAFIRERQGLGLVFEIQLGDDPVEAV